MAVTCGHLAPNGEKSILYDELFQKYGEVKAHDVWELIRSQQFLNKYGDWLNGAQLFKGITFEEDKASGYRNRTIKNASADATIALATDPSSAGEKLTHTSVVNQGKKYIPLDAGSFALLLSPNSIKGIVDKLNSVNAKTLNIAGNGIYTMKNVYTQDQVDDFTFKLLKAVTEHPDLKNKIELVRSGGQTGFDEAGGNAGLQLGIDTIILGPKGWKFRNAAGQDISNEKAFKARFKALSAIDTNGEPTIEWVEKTLGISDNITKMLSQIKDVDTTESIEHKFDGARDKTGRITEKNILSQIEKLYKTAEENPDNTYVLPYEMISEKGKTETGYTARELANLLDTFPIPSNVSLSPGIQSLIKNSQKNIIKEFTADFPVEFMNSNEPAVLESAAKLLIPIVVNGVREGFFTPQQQKEIVDTVVTATERLYRKDPGMKDRTIMQVMKWMGDKAKSLGDTEQGKYYTAIYDARLQVTEMALRQLSSLGLIIDNKTKDRIMDAIDRGTVPGVDKADWATDQANIDFAIENIEDGNFQEAGGRISRDWSDNTFELDPKDTASARIKMFMGTIFQMDKTVYKVKEDGIQIDKIDYNDAKQMNVLAKQLNRQSLWYKDQASSEKLQKYLEANYPRIGVDNFIGTPKVADYNDIFRKTLNLLGNRHQASTFEEFSVLLATHTDPTIQQMGAELQKADQSLKNEFMTVMMKQYQPFVTGIINKTQDEDYRDTYSLEPINTNRSSQVNSLIEHWRQQQKLSELTITSPGGDQVLDTERVKTKWLPLLKRAQGIEDWTLPENKAWFIKNVGRIMELSGIKLTDDMLTYMMKYPRNWSTASSTTALFATNLNGEPTGPLSIFIMKSGGLMTTSTTDSSDQRIQLSQLNNPLYTETTLLQGIAKIYNRYADIPYSSNHRNAKGKNIWDWGMNTKLSHAFRSMTATNADFNLFATNMDSVYIARRNWLIKTLRENPAQVEDLELAYMDMLKPQWGNRGTDRQEMSDREQMLMSISLFQNKGNGFNKKSKVHYMSLTHGDKTVTPIFKNVPKISTGDAFTTPASVIGTTESALYNIFKAEYDRIINNKVVKFDNKQYEQGKGLFFLIPDFNFDGMAQLVNQGVISQQEFGYIWPAGQKTLTRVIDSDRELPVINKVLANFMNNLVRNTITNWKSNGIVTEGNYIFDKAYVRKLMGENGIKIKVKEDRRVGESKNEYVDAQGKSVSIKDLTDRIVTTAAKDYAINTFIFNTSLSQLFYGDPAQAFKKSKEGNTDMDHVRSTFVEYTKRLAKDIAPRADLYWGTNRKYNTITLKDVETTAKYLGEIAELKKYYADETTTSTDAQEITTVQEKLDVLYAAGQVRSDLYNQMSAIITKAGPGGYYEFTQPDYLDIIMQPEKPIYAGSGVPQNGAILDAYVKSSAWSLYPPFTKGRELDGLRKMMEKNNIQRANFESAKKLGNPISPLGAFSSDGKFTDPEPAIINAAIQSLSRDGFGIQQEVPYDEDKETIKTLTQMNDGIVEGISTIDGFQIPDKDPMSGIQIKKFKEDVRKEMLQYNLDNLNNRLNIDESQNPDPERLYQIMEEEARSDTRNSYTLNELQSIMIRDNVGIPLIPITFNTAVDKFESLLISMVNKVSDVKMPGKSYVQASGTGVRLGKDSELSSMIPVNGWDGSPLKTLRIENGVVKPAQVILPFNFFDHNGNKLKLEDYLKDGKLDTEKIHPDLLQLVGGRIPNQGHSSMLPMEIVGFVPDNMGDIVFIPAEVVKQMGADFDVDKLYTYKRPYNYTEDGVIKPVENSDHRSLSNMQLDYFNVHWAILMHPDMITKVLKPLDKADLKQESALLKDKAGSYYNFYDPMNQMEDFQRGKEAKRLVGSSAWGNKFNARIQDKELQYSKVEYADGKINIIPAIIPVIDEHTGEWMSLSLLSGNGISNYTEKDGGEVSTDTQRTKGDNHSMILSESVDNMKYRTLDNLNLTPVTYKAAQAMIQLQTDDGWAPNAKYWTRLLTQPVIVELSRMMKQGNDSLSTSYDPKLYETVYNKLTDIYREEMGDAADMTDVDKVVFDPQLLLKAKSGEMDNLDFAIHQLAALQLFNKLYQIGDRMFQLEAQFNQDVSGAGRNLLGALNKQEQMDSIDTVPVMNAYSIYKDTEVGFTFDALNGTAISVLSQVLPYSHMKAMFTNLQSILNRKGLTIDQQRKFIKGFQSVTFTNGRYWWNDARTERVRLLFGHDSLARRLGSAQKTWGKDNPMLVRLELQLGNSVNQPDYITYRASGVAAATELQGMTTGWLDMLLSKDDSIRAMGEDLLRYVYLSGGVQDANSFVKFVPASFIANTEFAHMLRDTENLIMNTKDYTNEGYTIQFIQHNPELAPQVDKTAFGPLKEGREYPEVFPIEINSSEDSNKFKGLRLADDTFAPYASYYSKGDGRWILYNKMDAGVDTFYVRIDTLGNQYTDEYDGQAEAGVRSIFAENRSLADQVPGIISPLQSIRAMQSEIADTNWYQQAGIIPGGLAQFNQSLDNIATNRFIPQYLRSAAKFLRFTAPDGTTDSFRNFTKTKDNPIKVEFFNKLGVAGEAHFDNSISLNPEQAQSMAQAAETFLHEAIHNRLQYIILATGHDTRVENNGKLSDQFSNRIEQYKQQYPEIVKHVDELERIRYEGLNELRNRIGEQAYRDVQAEVESGVFKSDNATLYYALSSVQELVAHVMTEKTVAGFLNTVQDSKGKSLITKVWDKLMDMLAAFGRALGINIKNDSLLAGAISNTMRLLDMNTLQPDITESLLTGNTMIVDTEEQAEAMKELLETVYNREVSLESDETLWHINQLSNQARKVVPGQRGKILERLSDLLSEVSDARNRTPKENIVERTRLGIRYQEIRDQINSIHQTNDLSVITEIGQAQLQWVDNTLSSRTATPVDTNIALNISALWGNLVGILYGALSKVGEVNDEFTKLQTRAQKQRIELINTKSIEVLNKAFNGTTQLTKSDIGEGLKDIDVLSANVLALTRAKPMLVQATAHIGTKEANNRDEHIIRNTKRLKKLQAQMKDAGLTPDDMLQLDEEGENHTLVDRYTPGWYTHVNGLRKLLDARIDGINVAEGLTPLARAERRKDAWAKYWKEFNQSVDFVDIRHMFDLEGNRITGTEAEAKLIDKVGESYAKELITKAGELYNEYIDERNLMKEHIEYSVELTEQEAEGLSVQQADEALMRKQEREFNSWVAFNSPLELASKLDRGKDINFESHGDEWLTTIPKDSKYSDEKFTKIASDPKRLSAFNEYKDIHTEMVSYLPADIQDSIPDNHFPIVPKQTASWLAGIVNKIKNWDHEVLNALTATDIEEALRLRPDKIPVMYITPRGITKELAGRSDDPIHVLEAFSMMALQHRYMGNVLDTINIAENILKDVNRRRVEGEQEGKPLTNVMNALKYFKDVLVFKKPKELQGKINNTVYSLNPAKQAKIVHEVKELVKQKAELEQQRLDAMIEGDLAKYDELSNKFDEVDKKLTAYEKDARNIYGSKVSDTLVSINQQKALSYNPFSAVSNFSFAAISLSIHAKGKMDYGNKELRAAYAVMSNSMKKYWLFEKTGNNTAMKVHELIKRSGIIGDVVDSDYGKSNLASENKSKLQKSLDPFNWQRSGDYFTKGALMVAMMKTKQVEVTTVDGEVKTIPLWDAFNEEGEWDLSKYKANPSWYSDNISQQSAWAAQRDKMRKVSTIIFGNQDKNSPLLAKKNFLLRLAGQFRMSWFPEGIATRFKPEYYDVTLDRAVKGRWRTYGDLGIFTSGAIVAKQLLAALPGVKIDPFRGHSFKDGKALSDSAVDMENMRKNFAGLAWTVSMTAMILMLKATAEDDKKKSKAKAHKLQLVINMLIRNQQDLMLYSSPSVFNTISGNFLPATQVISDYWAAMKASGHYMFGDTKHEKDAFDKWLRAIARSGIPHPVATQYNKIRTMTTRNIDDLQR